MTPDDAILFSAAPPPAMAGSPAGQASLRPVDAVLRPSQRRFILILALFTLASVGVYLLASARTAGFGFPLDDAWIHQTYARNLALHGEWAFISGQPSVGSTAPLWSGLLAAGHAFGLGPYLWTYLLGGLLLLALALVGAWAFERFCPGFPGWAPRAAALLLFEWHLVWAAVSGMETLLLALLALAGLGWLAGASPRTARSWAGFGLLVGLIAWVRPDGVTLLGPAFFVLALAERDRYARVRGAAGVLAGFLTLFAPYLLFNRLLAGSWWPNTFYAKQAEYAALLAAPLWLRYARQWQPLLQGVGAVLLPGFLLYAWGAARRRSWGALAGTLWVAGYLALYAWRLPVAYQHGRYLMPVVPVFSLMGLAGLAGWSQISSSVLVRRVASRAWALAAGAVLVLYWASGAAAYAGDVAFIESEMVKTARWVATHTPASARVAAHDIGALGYFAPRPLLDLAGLVSPEVIPFIRDEARLEDYLNQQGAEYLVTFPGWYPQLSQAAEPLYHSGGSYAPRAGGENLVVFRWGRKP